MYDVESYVYSQFDDSWIALVVFGVLILISSIITTVVLCLLWCRHQQSKPIEIKNSTNIKSDTVRSIPMQSRFYETQKMEVFIPASEEDTGEANLNEIYVHVKSQENIPDMYQFYPRITKAYF